MIDETLKGLQGKTVFIFNFDFVVADPNYNRLLGFARKFNKGEIESFKELKIDNRKEIQVTYSNRIRVRYIHDANANYLDVGCLIEEMTKLINYI